MVSVCYLKGMQSGAAFEMKCVYRRSLSYEVNMFMNNSGQVFYLTMLTYVNNDFFVDTLVCICVIRAEQTCHQRRCRGTPSAHCCHSAFMAERSTTNSTRCDNCSLLFLTCCYLATIALLEHLAVM